MILNHRLRPMTLADMPLGMRLKELAGWNQTLLDWEMLLEAGSGIVAEIDGCPVGTATIVGYDGFSWVGMVLVDPAFRRRGIGMALLEAAIPVGQCRGSVRLDATPQGEPLYRRLGFTAEYGLTRLRRSGAGAPPQAGRAGAAPRATGLSPDALSTVVLYDAPVFGASRSTVLAALAGRAPDYAWMVADRGRIAGYCLGRHGSNCDQLGPIVAEDDATAWALLSAALSQARQRDIIIDVPDEAVSWLRRLEALGFIRQRHFARMYLGGQPPFGQPQRQVAIAGPEIG